MSISLWGEQKFAVYERFKNIRQASSLSRLELSIKTDISEKQIKNIETGRCGPSIDSLIRLSIALEVSSDYLLGLSDDPGPAWTDREY